MNLAVVQDVGGAIGGVLGVEGNVGGTGFQDGEEGDVDVGRAREPEGDKGAGGDALVAEVAGELVGAAIDFGVGEAGGGGVDGDGVGAVVGLGFEEFVEEFVAFEGGIEGTGAPVMEDGSAFLRGQGAGGGMERGRIRGGAVGGGGRAVGRVFEHKKSNGQGRAGNLVCISRQRSKCLEIHVMEEHGTRLAGGSLARAIAAAGRVRRENRQGRAGPERV